MEIALLIMLVLLVAAKIVKCISDAISLREMERRNKQLKEPVLALVGLYLKGSIDVMTACEELMRLKDLTVASLQGILYPWGEDREYIGILFLVQNQEGVTPKYLIEQLIKVFEERKSGKVSVKEK